MHQCVRPGTIQAAKSGKLSTRLALEADPSANEIIWSKFDEVKLFSLRYIRYFHNQIAVEVKQNRMVLQASALLPSHTEALTCAPMLLLGERSRAPLLGREDISRRAPSTSNLMWKWPQILLLLLDLVRFGFYSSSELVSDPASGHMGMLGPLLKVFVARP